MTQYDIPGLSVAVIRNEKLVYHKSFGYSNKEENKKASNSDLYRIANISKLITFIATAKLIEQGEMAMDERVFGANSVLRYDFGAPPAGSNKELLTMRHLLSHTSGWTNAPYDPMLANNNLTQSQIITDILKSRPLTYAPGTTFHDLNFGYCVLGRVIEKLNYMPYENYARSVFYDIGVTNIKIGGSTLQDRHPNEVKYYQQENNPYAMNLKRMDAHDGWIMSAKDLAKIMVRVDGNLNVPDMISTSITDTFNWGLDWAYYGSLPGTTSILHRLDDRFSFILLTNTRTELDPSLLINELDKTVIDHIKARSSWPSYDLF
jgi:CubicO group peptidase (beta-lactamase class C family)